MRLYFENNINNISKLKALESLKQKIIPNNILYSNEGLFLIEKKSIKKINIVDDFIEKNTINNLNFLIDHSKINYEIVHKIPFQHHFIKSNLIYYGLSMKSKIFLVIKENNNQIIDFYFETNENPNNYSIQEEINTLISYLN